MPFVQGKEMKTIQELKEFEDWVVNEYHKGNIRSPVHLAGSKDDVQEKNLIEIFKEINPQDWIFATYRSHYHALLKGIPEGWLKQWVKDNKSMHVMNKEHNFVTTAIVGAQISQAVGCAIAIKREFEKDQDSLDAIICAEHKLNRCRDCLMPHVWVFCGDMAASLGNFKDCYLYSVLNDLPITFVIEDNGLSTDTPTGRAWTNDTDDFIDLDLQEDSKYLRYFKYERIHPHYGTGKRVDFKDDQT